MESPEKAIGKAPSPPSARCAYSASSEFRHPSHLPADLVCVICSFLRAEYGGHGEEKARIYTPSPIALTIVA